MHSELITPRHWADYELLDCGGYEKLERFGPYIVARPEPQALWDKSLPRREWEERTDAWFRREKNNEERGEWFRKPGMPEQWFIGYNNNGLRIKMRLGLTSFKHVGVFPEQAENWNFIYERVKAAGAALHPKSGTPPARVLNLFAYTGGASLAARSAGADVTHVDSVRQVVTWSRENMEVSGLDGIRWIVEDALKFVRREAKRGKKYHGIVLDPPAYGRGPEGEKWVLEEQLNEMLSLCGSLLEERNAFLVLNLYSMGLSALLARTAVRQLTGTFESEQFGELYFEDRFAKALPLGIFYRATR